MDPKYNKLLTICKTSDNNAIKNELTVLKLRNSNNTLKNMLNSFKNIGSYFMTSRVIEEEEVLVQLYQTATIMNNIELCRYLVESKELNISLPMDDLAIWYETISSGNVGSLKLLVNTKKIKNEEKSFLVTKSLKEYTVIKNVEMFQYLLDDPTLPFYEKLKEKFKKAYPVGVLTRFFPFIHACGESDKKSIEFLCNHPEYKKMINCLSFYSGLEKAEYYNNIEVLDYLMTKSNLYTVYKDYSPTRLLIKAALNNHLDVVMYLIFDFKIQYPEDFKSIQDKLIEMQPFAVNKEKQLTLMAKTLEDLFEKRRIYESLEQTLETSSAIKKRLKI